MKNLSISVTNPIKEKMKAGTLAHLNKVLADMESRGWTDDAEKVRKNIAFVEKHGKMPKE